MTSQEIFYPDPAGAGSNRVIITVTENGADLMLEVGGRDLEVSMSLEKLKVLSKLLRWHADKATEAKGGR